MRLSLGKLLVNLLQVVKRTNTPLIPQQCPLAGALLNLSPLEKHPLVHSSQKTPGVTSSFGGVIVPLSRCAPSWKRY